MKKGRTFFQMVVFSALVCFGVAACGGGNGNQSSVRQEQIKITAADSKTNLILGETVQLTATNAEGVKWESEKPEIATVNDSGLVTSVAVGSTKITASKDGYRTGSITIKVDLETIQVTASANSVVKGETITVQANKEGVTWTSSNESVATVANGVVTGVSFGTATISASKDGFNAGSVEITVTRPAPTAVLDMVNAEHYAADGEWSSSNDPTEAPTYNKDTAPDGVCLAHFGAGDMETIRFSSNKAVKAELVLTIGFYYSIEDLTTVYSVKFNGNVVAFPAQGYEAEGTSNYTFKGLSFGELDLIADTNVLEITMKEDASRFPYMDNLEIYAAEAATITLVPAPQKDPVVVDQESISVKEGKTFQITSTMTGLSYKSASTSIATVSETGLVSGVKVGATTIAVSKEGYKTIRVPVTVTEAEGVIAVSINAGVNESGNVSFRTSQNLSEPYNYIVDTWGENEEVTYTVNNEGAAGSFNMYIRCRASGGYNSSTTDDLSQCMSVTVNGAPLTLSGTVSGNSFTDYLLGAVNLANGANTVVIKCLTTVPTMNMLRFIPVE